MVYDITNLTTATDATDLVIFANQASNGVLGVGLTLTVFFLAILSLRTSDMGQRIAVSSFITFVFSTILSFVGALNYRFPLGFLVLTAFSLLYLYTRN